jgi:hypothetical protein
MIRIPGLMSNLIVHAIKQEIKNKSLVTDK